jgi:hypothetical protein
LSAENLTEFVRGSDSIRVLPAHVIYEVIYAQDDASRGSLTFEEVKTMYMRLRPLLDSQAAEWAAKGSERSSPNPEGSNDSLGNVATENVILPFMPLLLYRVLVFACFVDDEGKVPLMRVFQVRTEYLCLFRTFTHTHSTHSLTTPPTHSLTNTSKSHSPHTRAGFCGAVR